MNFRGPVIAAIVLCALGGALYWSGHHKLSTKSAAAAVTSPPILNIDQPAITSVTLKEQSSKPITLEKSGTDKWKITAPEQYNADQDTVSGMLSSLSSLDSQRVIEDKAVNLQQYGLKQPAFEVDVTEKDHKTQRLDFGDAAPTGDAVYAIVAGNPKVFLTPSFNKSSLDKSLNDLRDKRLLPVNTDKVNRLEFTRNHEDIVFGRSKSGWEILKPGPLRTDSFAVEDLVNHITDARMDLGGAGTSDSEKVFAHATPVAVAKLTDDSGSQTLQVRKNKDTYYAASSLVKGDYKVDSSLGDALNKNLDDFRKKGLFDFSYNQPNRIELHNNAKAWLLIWNGKDWLSDGKKMDAGSVDSLVSKLRGLSASKFVSSGFSKPEITATVASQNGKDVEKVMIAKSGKNYIAKREDGTSLYELNQGDVTGLLQAADNVKPATPGASASRSSSH